MFFITTTTRIAARQTMAEVISEAEWNWEERGEESFIEQYDRHIADYKEGELKMIVRLH